MKMLLLLLLISQHASGVEVEVYEGVESVLLPCQLPVGVSSDFTAAVWDRDELKDPTVHVCLQSGDDFKDQNHRYTNRTSMRADALQTGDLSLTLRNPTVSDSGTYTCIYRKFGQDQSKTYVELKVTELRPRSALWFKVLSAVLVPAVLLAVTFGTCLYCRYKQLKNQKICENEVGSNVESAKLLCKATVHLSQVTKVVWKDRDGRNVHVYENGSDLPEKQHRRYRNRTEMNEDLLKTGDLSLTLKYPTNTDRDTYTCTVYSGDKVLMEKKVELKVKECELEVEKGVEFVRLPFQTTENLPGDSEVVWKRYEPQYMKVHVYEDGRNRPEKQDDHYRRRTEMKKDLLKSGDLSLTLKQPTVGDSGRYGCEVNSKEAWRYKRVWLTVKARENEVGSNVESAKLLCKATVHLSQVTKVVWKDRDGRNVHVYENGSDLPEKQHRRYRNRTEMNEDLLNTGDLSLTLKYPTNTDRDTYTCTVYSGDKVLMEKQVELKIKDCELEVEEGAGFVRLPFQTTENLPGDSEVVWKRYEPQYMKVHVYEEGRDRPEKQDDHYRRRTKMKKDLLKSGDLSLTLKQPTVGDSGRYGCEVNSKEAWRYKRVWLTVTGKHQDQRQTETIRTSSTDPPAVIADQSVWCV